MGPKCNDRYPYKRHTEEKADVKTEVEIGVLQPQTIERPQPAAADTGAEQILS